MGKIYAQLKAGLSDDQNDCNDSESSSSQVQNGEKQEDKIPADEVIQQLQQFQKSVSKDERTPKRSSKNRDKAMSLYDELMSAVHDQDWK